MYILFEKYINILALEMASPGNRHSASCTGALSFPTDNYSLLYQRLSMAEESLSTLSAL